VKLLLAIALIALISIIGSRLTFLNRNLPLGFRNILLTGTEYIFIGVILGGLLFNVLDRDTMKKMEPFLLFGLSWIGVLFGLQFEVRQIKTLPRYYFSISAVQSFVTFLTIAISMYLVLGTFSLFPESFLFIAAITLGSTASCTAQSALAIVNQNYRIKNRGLLYLMRYISSVDGLFALGFFSIALCIFPGGEISDFNFLKSIRWLFFSVLMGVIPALILISLNRMKFSQQEFILFMIGTIMFCGGLSYQIHHSPLVSGLLCGIITANFCRHRIRALSVVIHAEKSIYIILLLMIGASWHFKVDYSLIITGVYFLIRLFGKYIGAFMATKLFKPVYNVPSTFGLGLISEGGLAIAIIINFQLLYPSIADSLITIIILSVFVNELLAPRFILAQFDKPDPISAKVQQSMKKQ
jgi:hypothetical protein